MNTPIKSRSRPFLIKLSYSLCYYIKRVRRLEAVLARRPRVMCLEMIGTGEIPADMALLIRSVLMNRSPRTHLITHARSSLQNGSALVWLLGDTRIIRDDARLFFRRANLDESEDASEIDWKDSAPSAWNFGSEVDPEEGDQARVLQYINEFLPVKELAGRLIDVPVLRQFGLVDNMKVDAFLAQAFAIQHEADEIAPRPAKRQLEPGTAVRIRRIKK